MCSPIESYGAAQGGWQNRALVRMAAEFTAYNPIRSVPRVNASVLLVAATKDSLCPFALAERAAELNPKVRSVNRIQELGVYGGLSALLKPRGRFLSLAAYRMEATMRCTAAAGN